MRRNTHQRPIGKGATGGELVFDKVLDDGETSSVYINNRAKSGKGKHYISLYKTGDDHLAGGTVMRSPGGLYARAGDSIKSAEDNSDDEIRHLILQRMCLPYFLKQSQMTLYYMHHREK